ncbi:hypothetical protein Q9233_013957 [Columba guinea]|nr:hypothetical protein Q9233_013957 [Columba guinea]
MRLCRRHQLEQNCQYLVVLYDGFIKLKVSLCQLLLLYMLSLLMSSLRRIFCVNKGTTKQSFRTCERQPQIRDYMKSPGSRLRPASSGIAVSQRKVRQISDPVQQILIQLHKIIFITQLLQGSPELIEPNFFAADWHLLLLSSGGNTLLPDDRKGIVGTYDVAEGMTYEHLQTLIEEVLEESGYYNFSSNR